MPACQKASSAEMSLTYIPVTCSVDVSQQPFSSPRQCLLNELMSHGGGMEATHGLSTMGFPLPLT